MPDLIFFAFWQGGTLPHVFRFRPVHLHAKQDILSLRGRERLPKAFVVSFFYFGPVSKRRTTSPNSAPHSLLVSMLLFLLLPLLLLLMLLCCPRAAGPTKCTLSAIGCDNRAEQQGEVREGAGGAGGHAADGAVAARRGSGRVLRVLYPPTDVEAYSERGHGETSPPSKMGKASLLQCCKPSSALFSLVRDGTERGGRTDRKAGSN